MKVFITGITGSGKTYMSKFLSQLIGIPYVNFDKTFNYQAREIDVSNFLNNLPKHCVVDAIPFSKQSRWEIFIEKFNQSEEIKIVCCYCSNQDVWINRIKEKYPKDFDTRWLKIKSQCKAFYMGATITLNKLNSIYFDTYMKKVNTFQSLQKEMAWIKKL